MARTITTIYDELVAEMASYDSMTGLSTGADYAAALISKLDSGSRVAIWSLYLWVVAFGIWTLEQLFDNHKAEVEVMAAATISGNAAWLVRQAKVFEAGNSSIVVTPSFTVSYAVSNPEARIVSHAAVTREYGRAVLKVAKAYSGLPVPLSDLELGQLATYINHVMYAGSKVVVVSRAADKMKVGGTIYYDGLLNPADVEAAIEAKLSAYLNVAPFDSLISLAKVTDQIQSVDGVLDIGTSIFCRRNGDSYSTNPTPGPTYMPWSGFVTLDMLDLTFVAV